VKKIAWGFSKLYQMHLEYSADDFAYCVDSSPKVAEYKNIPVFHPDILEKEDKSDIQVIIFAVSSNALSSIAQTLVDKGFIYGKEFLFYSDFFYASYAEKLQNSLVISPSYPNYVYSKAFTLNSKKPMHTTVLGTHLFLELLRESASLPGAIAEIGAFEGGNAYCALTHPDSNINQRPYYLFDSFEGFPDIHEHDPAWAQKGDYATHKTYQQILADFALFPQAKVIKGFVPETFSWLEHSEFSLIFYDCDLYQPAIDTFAFFWEKIVPGGYLLIHDYECEENGFSGVKDAVRDFFGNNLRLTSFYQNTMAVIQKKYAA
jgi:hypothetical protein